MAIIVISKETMGDGMVLAKSVAEKLGYNCLSREELLENSSSQFAVGADILSTALDQNPRFLGDMKLERLRYIAYVRATLLKAIRDDNIVYHGQVGHLLVNGHPYALKVRVVARMESRIKVAMESFNLSREEAVKFIKKVDERRAKWARLFYNLDWRDLSLYDLTVDVERTGIPAATEMVAGTATMPPFQTPPDSNKIMDDLVLSADIQTKIVEQKGLDFRNIKVDVDGGVVTITGKVDTMHEADRIREVIRETSGVKDIDSRLRIRYSDIPTFG